MRNSTLCLVAALGNVAAMHLAAPAQACKSPPQSTKLCAVVPVSAEVRDAPNGHVAHGASGRFWLPGAPKMGCGACAATSASANEPGKP